MTGVEFLLWFGKVGRSGKEMLKQVTRSLAKAEAGLNRQLSDQSFWSWSFSTLLTGASEVSANRFGQLIEIGHVID
jgi:hypothetical protein